MNKKLIYVIVTIILGLFIYLTINIFYSKKAIAPLEKGSIGTVENEEANILSYENIELHEPIADFKERITKKPFAIYITQQNSPIKPEKYSGYHTGVDIEYELVSEKVPVYAISDSEIIYKNHVNGYGGVIALWFNYNKLDYIALYGHLEIENSPSVGTIINKGYIIGYLGEDQTSDTDFERKHLHFGLINGKKLDLRGYVQDENELTNWINPVEILK